MIGVYGGSFDPIHNGHLRAALETCERLALEKLLFVPCYQHALDKQLQANVAQRIAMLQLAINKQPLFALDQREIQRQTRSYTIDTLISLQRDYPQQRLALIMGTDALLSLPQWQDWQKLTDYAVLVILHRPGYQLPASGILKDFLDQQISKNIVFIEMPLLDISSSYIREQCRSGHDPRYLLPDAVADYITQHQLYI